MSKKLTWINFETLLEEIKAIKTKINKLENLVYLVIDDRDNKIKELESMANPYSDNGSPICNSGMEEKDRDWEL
jgi:hypothetical protein